MTYSWSVDSSIRGLVLAVLSLGISVGFGCTGIFQAENASSEKSGSSSPESGEVRTVKQKESGQTWTPDGGTFDEYPPSPPEVVPPIYTCSTKVSVESVIENAEVTLYTGSGTSKTKTVGETGGPVVFEFSTPLSTGTRLFAEQKVNGVESPPSPMVEVKPFPEDEAIPKPTIRKAWKCGNRVGIKGVEKNLQTRLEQAPPNGTMNLLTKRENTSQFGENYHPIWTNDLSPAGDELQAHQVYCPNPVSGESTRTGPKSEREPIQQPPKPLPPLDEVSVAEGQHLWKFDGSYVGAWVEGLYQPSGGSLQVAGGFHTWLVGLGMTVKNHEIDTSANDYGARHTLCGNGSDPVEAQVVPEGAIQQNIDQLEIIGPICPKNPLIRFRNTFPGARILIEMSGTPIASARASAGVTKVQLPAQTLEAGETLQAVQVVHRPSQGNLVSDPASTQITAGGNSLRVYGSKWYESQNTGRHIEGFLNGGDNPSGGPIFEIQCCENCEYACNECVEGLEGAGDSCVITSQNRTAAVDISRNGNHVAQVELDEVSPGRYRGRWDWFDPSTDHPPAGDYTVEVIDSPCGEDFEPKEFSVLIGEPNPSDLSAPDPVTLTVDERLAPRTFEETTDNSGSSASVTIDQPGTTLRSEATDTEGLEELELNATSHTIESGQISDRYVIDGTQVSQSGSGLRKKVDGSKPPIPQDLRVRGGVYLYPYEQVTFTAKATNFAGDETSSADITVTAAHSTPILDRVAPDPAAPSDTLDLFGLHHGGVSPTLDTVVKFDAVNSSESATTTNFNFEDEGWYLRDVEIPSAFNNFTGDVEVRVETTYTGSLHSQTTKTSAPVTIKIDSGMSGGSMSCKTRGIDVFSASFKRWRVGYNNQQPWSRAGNGEYWGTTSFPASDYCGDASNSRITLVDNASPMPDSSNVCSKWVKLEDASGNFSDWIEVPPNSSNTVQGNYPMGNDFRLVVDCSPAGFSDPKENHIRIEWKMR